MEKVFKKASDGMAYVKEGVTKVRSKPWAEPIGVALGATANICDGLGNFVPGMGFLGGALKMGSCLLNPAPTLEDLQRDQREIENNLKESSGNIKEILERELKELKEEMQKSNKGK